MLEPALLDNDVILKTCCYSIVGETLTCLQTPSRSVFILGAARFVVRDRISRGCGIFDRLSAAAALEEMLVQLDELEPDGPEIELAARFEAEAQAQRLALDSGESLLLAALLQRNLALLLTGDKRAISAIECLMRAAADGRAKGRVACLEQLIIGLLSSWECDHLRDHICREPKVDRALSVCFACASGTVLAEVVREGLASYVRAIRRDAPTVLVRSEDLSAVIA